MPANLADEMLRIELEADDLSRAKLWRACLECVGDDIEGCDNGVVWGPCPGEYGGGLVEKKGPCPCTCHRQLEPGPTNVTGLADENECPSDHWPCDLPCVACGARI
jgi:hypothetical protein